MRRATRTKIGAAMRRRWAERKARRFVYAAGPMTGITVGGARTWRRKITNVLERAGFTVLDPTRRDKDMAPDEVYGNDALTDPERRFIHDADLRDLRMADVFLLYLNAEAVSIGSIWEAGWADILGKPIVIAVADSKYRDHPFVTGCGARVFPALPEAIRYIIATYAKEETHAKVG